jgi:MOSC domain-containing protein YiiM
MVRRLNVDGDGQGDLAGHGGEQRAVMVYQIGSYDFWKDYLGRDDLEPGHFGENFTIAGLPDDEVCVGDRYRIGEAEFEVTQPRVTCFRVGMRLNEPRMPNLLVSEHRRWGSSPEGPDSVHCGSPNHATRVRRCYRSAWRPTTTAGCRRRVQAST